MADNPKSSHSTQVDAPPHEAETYQDYAGALKTIASARSVFLVLLLLTLVVHGVAYGIARWSPQTLGLSPSVEEDAPPAVEPEIIRRGQPIDDTLELEEDTEATTDGAAATDSHDLETEAVDEESRPRVPLNARLKAEIDPDGDGVVEGAKVRLNIVPSDARESMETALPLAVVVGFGSAILLLFCYLLSVNVMLAGRLGGVRGGLSAFFWMVIVLLLMMPWSYWLSAWPVPLPGVYLTANDLFHLQLDFEDTWSQIEHYTRYLAYPILVLLIVLAADRRYSRGYRLAHRQIEARLVVRRL